MQDKFYTQDAERPDLAALEVGNMEGFIADQVLPVSTVADKTGTVYYKAATADEEAQENRAAGAAPAGTQIATASTTFTAAEIIDRGKVTPEEAKQMGGIEKADEVGAKFAKRSVLRLLEGKVRAAIMAGPKDYTTDAAKVQLQIQAALDSMELYEGRRVMIASKKVIKALFLQTIAEKAGISLCRIVTGTSSSEAAKGLSFAAWVEAMKIFFDVDDVLVGNNAIWNPDATAGRFTIAKVDDGMDPLSHKYRPVLGKQFRYLPDPGTPFVVRSVPDKVNMNNLYDAQIWNHAVILNSGAFKIFDGVDTSAAAT